MAIAKINGQGIYFEDSGGNGPAVIFMHGFLMDHTMFDHQVNELVPQYRCIRWDARGFGKTQWDGQPFNLYDSASDCIGLMDYLKIDSAIIVGMSQGGYCALRMALKHPERVKALALMSTRSGTDEEPVKEIFRQTRDTWKNIGPIDPLIEGLASVLIGDKNHPDIEKYWSHWTPKWKQIPGENIYHAMNNLLDRDEITHQLSQIQCKAWVVHGAADFGTPMELGKALSEALPQCRGFLTVPGAAHVANLTHAEWISPKLKDFLDSLEA
jgi:pimeloyl-ACP methyl ester carboxylesterase